MAASFPTFTNWLEGGLNAAAAGSSLPPGSCSHRRRKFTQHKRLGAMSEASLIASERKSERASERAGTSTTSSSNKSCGCASTNAAGFVFFLLLSYDDDNFPLAITSGLLYLGQRQQQWYLGPVLASLARCTFPLLLLQNQNFFGGSSSATKKRAVSVCTCTLLEERGHHQQQAQPFIPRSVI